MPQPTFFIKQNDDRPHLDAFLRDDKDRPVDVTGASVKFNLRAVADNSVKISAGSVSVTNATEGAVRFTWTTSNTDTSGNYQGEFQVTFGDASVETFPNDGYVRVVITDDVA
jgi:hypothetical protein